MPGVHRAPGSSPALHELSVPCTPVILALWRWMQRDQKFKVILSYMASPRPAWAKCDPVSKVRGRGRDVKTRGAEGKPAELSRMGRIVRDFSCSFDKCPTRDNFMEEGVVLPHSSRVQIWGSQGGRKWLKKHTLAVRSGNQMDAGTQPADFLLVVQPRTQAHGRLSAHRKSLPTSAA